MIVINILLPRAKNTALTDPLFPDIVKIIRFKNSGFFHASGMNKKSVIFVLHRNYNTMNQHQEVLEIFRSGVDSVLPNNLINNHISLIDNDLICQDVIFNLEEYEHIYLTGFGKASAGMARAMEKILGERLTGGHILTKYHHTVPLKKCTITEAGHPLPDQNGVEGTKKIEELLLRATKNDLIIVLISGGGSSLLTDLPEGIRLDELVSLNKLLVNSGANIQEINSVRKHLSRLKGGQMVRLAYPATVLTFLISDVVGDPLDVIASGPTVADPSTFGDALQVIEKYNLPSLVAPSVLEYLKRGKSGYIGETVKATDPCLLHTLNILLGNNRTALEQSKKKAIVLGYDAIIVSNEVEGDVSKVAEMIFSKIKTVTNEPYHRKIAILFGGEPTVQPTGNGKGGRNQHLVLLMAQKLAGSTGITFLSAGTDGSDGPTDATGAICDGTTLQLAIKNRLDPAKMILNFDSYPFFEVVGGHIKTGPTFTNVMDIMIALIDK